MGRIHDGDYAIRIPLKMIQLTKPDGRALPIAFYWTDGDGAVLRVKIDKVLSCIPAAELISGVAGDRYECLIAGQHEYLYYSLLAPRKWFRLKPVSEGEYKAYYRLPEESVNDRTIRTQNRLNTAELPAGRADEVSL